MTRPACITGVHRAGTSMVAHAAQARGIWLGHADDLLAGAPDNPDGFFEHVRLVAANDLLFERLGAGWDCPPTLGDGWRDLPAVAAARTVAAPVIDELTAQSPWGWKDPRLAPVLPFWLDLVPGAVVVLCVRNPLEVAASLSARNGTSLALGLRLWHHHYSAALGATEVAGRLVTHYDAWFERPADEVDRLDQSLELDADEGRRAAARAVPARHRRHARFDARSLRTAGVANAVLELYAQLCDEAEWPDGASSALTAEPASAPAAPPAGEAPTAGTWESVGVPSANGDHSPGDSPGDDVGRVDRAVVELGVAEYTVYKRNGRVAQLEKRVAELEAELQRRPPAGPAAAASSAAASPSLEDLQAGLYDLQLAVAELGARALAPADPAIVERDIAYARMIREVRAAVRANLPAGADILVLSESEPALVDLHSRRARHLPVDPRSPYPAPKPSSGVAAAAHLVARRALGATHLIVPPTAAWWFGVYPEFADQVAGSTEVIATTSHGASIRRFVTPSDPARWPSAAAALVAARSRLGREPAVLDWTDSAAIEAAFRPLDPGDVLPYLDASIEVVAVAAGASAGRHAEAGRVAGAGVLIGGPDGWRWSWTASPPATAVDLVVVADGAAPPAGPFVAALLASLPPGHEGTVTAVVPEPVAAAWRDALDGRGDAVVLDERGPAAALAAVAGRSGPDLVAVLDGGATPLPDWLPALVWSFAHRDRCGLVGARRRAHGGEPIVASRRVGEEGLEPVVGAQADRITTAIDVPVPGAVVTRRGLLASVAAHAGYRTLGYTLAAYARSLRRDGYEVLGQPEAEVVDLALTGPPADALAADHGRFTQSPAAVVA